MPNERRQPLAAIPGRCPADARTRGCLSGSAPEVANHLGKRRASLWQRAQQPECSERRQEPNSTSVLSGPAVEVAANLRTQSRDMERLGQTRGHSIPVLGAGGGNHFPS